MPPYGTTPENLKAFKNFGGNAALAVEELFRPTDQTRCSAMAQL
jgi:hypothetical protein